MNRSKHLQDTYTKMTKKEYLEGVKTRLVNDVGTYFTMIDIEGDKGNSVGFWGSARLIFPVIEAVAKTIYKKRGTDDLRVVRLLKELNITYPDIVWQMFRNSLAHSDVLIHISKGKTKTISWSVTTSAGGISIGHLFTGDYLLLDTRRLYEDFLAFLDREIGVATTSVYVKTGMNVGRKYGGRLASEIDSFPS